MSDYVFNLIKREQHRQDNTCELIASENFVSENIKRAMGSCFTNKYAEGYPTNRKTGNKGRYYGGCEVANELEEYCCDLWRKVFKTDYHVNVQLHSGTHANMAAYAAVMEPYDTLLSMSLDVGGHLSHGSLANFSGHLYNCIFYGLDEGEHIDYIQIGDMLAQYHPKAIMVGASAYSRKINYKKIRKLIDTHNPETIMIVDMAHIAGLIAAEEHPSPFGYADIITTTTHKSLRGPRGGLIFCRPELARAIDSAVFPYSSGGPHLHTIAAKAICAEEALMPEFKQYIQNVKVNAKAMSNRFKELGYRIVSGGTSNHMFLLDLTDTGLTGKEVQDALDKIGITVNKNCIPNEKRSPKETSGIRIGTPAMTTKGYNCHNFIEIADEIDECIKDLQHK